VEVTEGEVALERHQRKPAIAEQRLEIEPGTVRALGGDVVAPVQDVVEDLQTEVRTGFLAAMRVLDPDDRSRSLRIAPRSLPR
jgi:hypothetical protein